VQVHPIKIKVTGSKTCPCVLFVGDVPSTERQSCL